MIYCEITSAINWMTKEIKPIITKPIEHIFNIAEYCLRLGLVEILNIRLELSKNF